MKMFVAHPGPFGPNQREVLLQQLILHNGAYLALHRPARLHEKYDMWIVSDYLTGMMLSQSISKNYAIEKAKKLVSSVNKQKMQVSQNHGLKKLMSSFNGSVDFKLLERIERKCAERGTTSVRVMKYR
ncbi:hypothetical protein ACFTQ7_02200 [Lysinibacillus sp. NPDC056959]|uniref:hypothetical protein n=1 Tax=Lysinibacillus sp. NPDC056959 TaxID=3345981 RepID=UPI00362B0B1C